VIIMYVSVSVPSSLRIGIRPAYSAVGSDWNEYAILCPALPLASVFGDIRDIRFDDLMTVVCRAQGK